MHRLSRRVQLALLVSIVFVCSAGRLSAQPASGRALALEDYYRIQSVGNPQISPDGKWVCYTVATRIEEDNGTRTETWLVATDAAATPRRILHYGRDVANAAWTEDLWLQYEASGTWTIEPGAPSAVPRAGVALPRGSVRSPDGRWIAGLRDQATAKEPVAESSEFERRHEQRFKGVMFDWKDFQRDGAPFPAPNLRARPASQVIITPVAGGEPRALAAADLRPEGLQWHPDGRSLVFIADSHWRDELLYERSDLWTVSVDGQLNRLTDDWYNYDDAQYSPDGRYLSFVRSYGTDFVIRERLNHGGPRDLFIRPVAGGEPINLTAAWDLEPRGTSWSPDSRYIYFSASIGGATHLFRVPAAGGPVEQVTAGERRIGAVSIDRSFQWMAYTVGGHDFPGEVFSARIDGSQERQLSDVHRPILDEIAFSKAERLLYRSYDGTQIEGWLLFPYAYQPDKGPYPLIVTSHGGPHSATGYSFDFKKQLFAASGYFVLDTNFRSSTGYGEAFKWATWGEWGNKDGEDVVSGIDHVLKRFPIDAARVGHTGHSYGGFLTNWVITQYPDRFAAAICGAGISNWISDYGTADIYRTKETEFYGPPWDAEARRRMIQQSPLTYADRVRTPTLFVHGEVDQRVPYEEAEQMYFALKRRGVPAKMIQYAGQAHGISGHWNNVHRMMHELRWWARYLKSGAGSER